MTLFLIFAEITIHALLHVIIFVFLLK